MIELLKFTVIQRIAYLFHKGVVEIQVVNYAKAHSKHFSRLEEMTDIGS
jgi:hypothetical protein